LLTQSPEERELDLKRRELDALAQELAAKELGLNDLSAALLTFQCRYLAEVGSKYVTLDELKAKLAELKAQAGGGSTRAADDARERHRRSSAEYDTLVGKSALLAEREEASDETRKLYRRIAAIIHPDRSTDENSRALRTRLMAELNEAYTQRDIARMNAVLAAWQESPEAIAGEGVGPDLIRTIRAIAQTRRRIVEIDQETSELLASELHRLMLDVRRGASVGRDVLADMAVSLEAQIDGVRADLALFQR
jgi:hypothetical protein